MFVLSLMCLCICPDRRPAFGSFMERVCVCPDWRPAFGSFMEGVCPDWRPAFGSCREGVCCVYVPTGDLLSGLVGSVCVFVSRPATCFRVL